MPVVFGNNLDVQKAVVLDARCVGNSGATATLPNSAQGLLRYETDTDNWKYYKDDTVMWQPLIPAQTTQLLPLVTDANGIEHHLTPHGIKIGALGFVSNFSVNASGDVLAVDINAAKLTANIITAGSLNIPGVLSLTTSGDIYSNSVITGRLEMPGVFQVTTLGNIYATSLQAGSVTANSFYNVCDDRVKWEESPIKTGLNVVNQLRPNTYWKGNKIDVEPTENDRRWEAGFIAQEVQKIPELEHAVLQAEENGEYFDGMYTLNYSQIQPYIVAATQELHKMLNELKARIAVLES